MVAAQTTWRYARREMGSRRRGVWAVALLVALAGCRGDRNPDGISLAEMTQRQCRQLTNELAIVASEYRASKPGQYLRFGMTFEERGFVSFQVLSRLDSCLGVRRGEQATLDDLGRRLAITREQFSAIHDAQKSAAGLDALAAISREIDALPLRD